MDGGAHNHLQHYHFRRQHVSKSAGTLRAQGPRVPHFYPKHLDDFAYVGKYSYALTFSADQRVPRIGGPEAITLVVEQFRRASRECGFCIFVHCIMPDHAHLLVDGKRDESDCRAFIKRAKQYSGYYYKQRYGCRLWQRYGYERVIRDDMERALTIRYYLANPVRAGIVADPRRFVGLGSDVHSVQELIMISEYTDAYAIE
jgi:REP element-mobilizing transposase RayT